MTGNRMAIRWIWILIKSALAASAICANLAESKIRGILGMENLRGLILGLGIFAIYAYLDSRMPERRRKTHWTSVLCAAMFAGIVLIGKSFSLENFCDAQAWRDLIDVCYGRLTSGQPFSGRSSFAPITASASRLLSSGVIFLGCFLLFERAMEFAYAMLTSRKPGADAGYLARIFPDKASVWRIAAMILTFWLPYLIANFPGGSTGDMGDQLGQFFGYDTYTAQHSTVIDENVYLNTMNPVAHTLYLGFWCALLRRGSDITLGFFVFNLIQTGAFAYVLARSLTAMRKLGLPRSFRLGALAFYCLNPLLPLFAFSAAKDTPFAMLLLLLTVQLTEVYLDPERLPLRRFMGIAVTTFLFILFRGNAIYIAIFAVPAAYLAIHRKAKLRQKGMLALALIVPILLSTVVTSVVYPAFSIRKGSARESKSMMFQQSARYALAHPDEVTEEERAAISAVLAYDEFSYRYFPGEADAVKMTYNESATKEELDAYTEAWLAHLKKHPLTYFEAAVNMSFAYYYPGMRLADYWMDFYVGSSETFDLGGETLVIRQPRINARLSSLTKQAVMALSELPIIGAFFNMGVYAWALIAIAALCIRARTRVGLLLIPFLALLLGLNFTAVNGALRYALGIIAAMPFLAALGVHGLSQKRPQIPAVDR